MSIIEFRENPEINYSLALKKIEEQDYLFAIRLLRDAIRLSPLPKYYIELAVLYYKLGQYDESTATYVTLSKIFASMEVALGALYSHQKSLGVEINPEGLFVSAGCFFDFTRRKADFPKLNNIIKEYHRVALKIDEPKIINIKENKNLALLQKAKELALNGDYSQAMILLDKVTDEKYLDKVLELRSIVYFGAEDYEKCIEECKKYNAIKKGNPTIARSVLYSIYVLSGKKINTDFRNQFIDFEKDLFDTNKPENIIALYELAEMVGYSYGASKLIKKCLKCYPYDLMVLATGVAYYGAGNNFKELDKLLYRLNEIFPTSPSVAFYNCLRKSWNDKEFSSECWYSLVYDNITKHYAKKMVSQYLKQRAIETKDFDENFLKIAITFFEVEHLRELLKAKEIEELDIYENMLIWGIENPYLGVENKILLIELYVSKYNKNTKKFIIPTELGINCLCLVGLKSNSNNNDVCSVYNRVYSNLILIEQDFDKKVLLDAIDTFKGSSGMVSFNLLCACVHLAYYGLKKYEPHTELVADAYKVPLNDLKIHFEGMKF